MAVMKVRNKLMRAEQNISALQRHMISIRNSRGTQMVERTVHNIEVRDSLIQGGGMGCFAKEDIPLGEIAMGYGGEVITNSREAICRRDASADSHIRRAGSIFHWQFLDSRINDIFTLAYYTDNGLLGGVVNDHCGKRDRNLKPNVRVEEVEEWWEHPYARGIRVTTRVFYVALRDIK
eukprot:1526315-Rhodomonas_salina.1